MTFAVAAIWIGGVTLANAEPRERLPLLGRFAIAAIGAAVLAAPIPLRSIWPPWRRAAADRRWRCRPIEVMGEAFPPMLRQFLDMPAFWVILLVIELPAIYLTGAYAMLRLTKDLDARAQAGRDHPHPSHRRQPGGGVAYGQHRRRQQRSRMARGAARLLRADRVCGRRPLAMDQDAGPARRGGLRRHRAGAAERHRACSTTTSSASRDPAGEAFAATPEMWAAVRRHAGPTDRVGNNPLFLRVDDAVAGQYLLGAPVEPALLLRRRTTSRCRSSPLPRERLRRSTRSSIACLPATAGRTIVRDLATTIWLPRHRGDRARRRMDARSLRHQPALAAGRDQRARLADLRRRGKSRLAAR